MPANIGDLIFNGIFIGDFWGFLLSIPVSLFLAFWLSSVKKRGAVVAGAFVGALLGFLIILAWALLIPLSTTNQPLPGANPGAVFFGSILFCSVLGLSGGILTDLLVAGKNRRDYLRSAAQEQHG
jgi:hypothetical protein